MRKFRKTHEPRHRTSYYVLTYYAEATPWFAHLSSVLPLVSSRGFEFHIKIAIRLPNEDGGGDQLVQLILMSPRY
jgi:hypothetical protein